MIYEVTTLCKYSNTNKMAYLQYSIGFGNLEKFNSISTRYKLYKHLVLSILLYECEIWTLFEKFKKEIRSFESKAHRRLLNITYKPWTIYIYVYN